MLKAMKAIFDERGPKGFTIGYFGIQYRQAMWSACYFASLNEFERLVKTCVNYINEDADVEHDKGLKMFIQLFSGFAAGVFGAAFNTPGDTIRTVIQKSILGGNTITTPTFIGTAQDIIQKRGVGALYAGFGSKAVHLGGGGALMAFLIPFFDGKFSKVQH